MYSALLYKLTTLTLSACAFVLETSGTSVQKSLKRPPVSTARKEINIHQNTNIPHAGIKFILSLNSSTRSTDIDRAKLDSNSRKDAIHQDSSHRSRRATEQDRDRVEAYFSAFSSDVFSNITTHNDSVSGGNNSSQRQPHDTSRSGSYKDPNRTRKMTSPSRHTTAGRSRNTEDLLVGNTVSRSPINEDETRDGEADSDSRSFTDKSEDTFTEFTRRQNRPPWLDKDPDDVVSESSENVQNEGSETGDTLSRSINVTHPASDTLDTAGSNFTRSYENPAAVTSTPGDTAKLTPSPGHVGHEVASSVDRDDMQVSPSSSPEQPSPTSPVVPPKKDRRRRIRHQKSRNKKRYGNSKKRRKLIYKEQFSETGRTESDLQTDMSIDTDTNERQKLGRVLPKPLVDDTEEAAEDEDNEEEEEEKEEGVEDGVEYDDEEEEEEEQTEWDGEVDPGETKTDQSSADCPTCGKNDLTEEDVKQIKLGMFTELLSQKLRLNPEDLDLETPREADGNDEARMPKLPLSVLEQMFNDNSREDEKEEFYARDQELIIPGEDMAGECSKKHATGCYTFHLRGKIKGEVAEAQLWLYKMRDRNDIRGQTFFVCELDRSRNDALKCSNRIARMDTFTKEDWVSMNVTRAVMRWVDTRKDSEDIAIMCSTCGTRSYKALYGTKEGYKPLLIIKYATESLYMRGKRSRSSSCDPRFECCKRPLVVSFRDISMPNIIQPRNLSVGFCYGYCDGIDQFTFNHTAIKQHVRWSDSTAHQPLLREQLKPCCVPLVLKDSFIMTHERGSLVRKILPKVIVERCGCL